MITVNPQLVPHMYMDFLKIMNEEVKSISNDTSYRLCLYCNVGDTGKPYSAFLKPFLFTYLNGQWWWVGYGVKVAARVRNYNASLKLSKT